MATLLVQHKVKDFAAWKTLYDSAAELRAASGELSDKIYRSVDDPNNLTLIFTWDSFDNAKKWFQSPELKAKMEQAGVLTVPSTVFLNEA